MFTKIIIHPSVMLRSTSAISNGAILAQSRLFCNSVLEEELILKAEPRQIVKKACKKLRREGIVPGILFGAGISNKKELIQFKIENIEYIRSKQLERGKWLEHHDCSLLYNGKKYRVKVATACAHPLTFKATNLSLLHLKDYKFDDGTISGSKVNLEF